jgi:DNA-binding transcriptional LysR family regulator
VVVAVLTEDGITLRQLRCFVAAVETGSLTAAAAQLGVAQTSLSAQVTKLERLVGGALVERGRFGVRGTAAGEVLLPSASGERQPGRGVSR